MRPEHINSELPNIQCTPKESVDTNILVDTGGRNPMICVTTDLDFSL